MEPAPIVPGQLRIYLGFAPGVGTTCTMLDEGRRRAGQGSDVVVGCAETHGRPHTAGLLAGLEVIPPAAIPCQGATAEEMDLGAVLARRPQVALVDDLAHSNWFRIANLSMLRELALLWLAAKLASDPQRYRPGGHDPGSGPARQRAAAALSGRPWPRAAGGRDPAAGGHPRAASTRGRIPALASGPSAERSAPT